MARMTQAALKALLPKAMAGEQNAVGQFLAGIFDMLLSGGTEVLTAATKVLSATDSGKTFFLSKADGIAVTLPALAAGLRFTFIVQTSVTSTGYTIATNGGADVIAVSVNELETDTGDDGPYDDNADLVTLVANLAVIGDRLDFYCDGTLWYCIGQTKNDGAVTSATT